MSRYIVAVLVIMCTKGMEMPMDLQDRTQKLLITH